LSNATVNKVRGRSGSGMDLEEKNGNQGKLWSYHFGTLEGRKARTKRENWGSWIGERKSCSAGRQLKPTKGKRGPSSWGNHGAESGD